MDQSVLVAGGGIGGLACALALARAGQAATVLEQAGAFGEVGAGLQLGPNAVRVLHDWGLAGALQAVAAWPDRLCVRDARDGRQLGQLRLGEQARARYGHAYATLHRADLHQLLLSAVQQQRGVTLRLDKRLTAWAVQDATVRLQTADGETLRAPALVGCDGLWSAVGAHGLDTCPPRATGHLAYRGMVRADALAPGADARSVSAWLGPRHHVVHYPVRRGDWINVVAVVHGRLPAGGDARSWRQAAEGADLRRALGPVCGDLRAVIDAVPQWTLWQLHDRAAVASPGALAHDRVALLGDAAHPMRPYLAQGAAMALEDAWTLGRLLPAAAGSAPDWPSLFARYAQLRWPRVARVQRQSQRNGRIFHADGLLRVARNAAMALLGERLLDNPWLYAGPADPGGPT